MQTTHRCRHALTGAVAHLLNLAAAPSTALHIRWISATTDVAGSTEAHALTLTTRASMHSDVQANQVTHGGRRLDSWRIGRPDRPEAKDKGACRDRTPCRHHRNTNMLVVMHPRTQTSPSAAHARMTTATRVDLPHSPRAGIPCRHPPEGSPPSMLAAATRVLTAASLTANLLMICRVVMVASVLSMHEGTSINLSAAARTARLTMVAEVTSDVMTKVETVSDDLTRQGNEHSPAWISTGGLHASLIIRRRTRVPPAHERATVMCEETVVTAFRSPKRSKPAQTSHSSKAPAQHPRPSAHHLPPSDAGMASVHADVHVPTSTHLCFAQRTVIWCAYSVFAAFAILVLIKC